MMDLEENVVYERLPTCPDTRITSFYRYNKGVLYCRSHPNNPWTRSVFEITHVIPWLTNVIPPHLRVSEGL